MKKKNQKTKLIKKIVSTMIELQHKILVRNFEIKKCKQTKTTTTIKQYGQIELAEFRPKNIGDPSNQAEQLP